MIRLRFHLETRGIFLYARQGFGGVCDPSDRSCRMLYVSVSACFCVVTMLSNHLAGCPRRGSVRMQWVVLSFRSFLQPVTTERERQKKAARCVCLRGDQHAFLKLFLSGV